MKRYYKINADLSLLTATPALRQVKEVANIIRDNKNELQDFIGTYHKIPDLEHFLQTRYKMHLSCETHFTYLQEELLKNEKMRVVYAFIEDQNENSLKVIKNCGFIQAESYDNILIFKQTPENLAYIAQAKQNVQGGLETR